MNIINKIIKIFLIFIIFIILIAPYNSLSSSTISDFCLKTTGDLIINQDKNTIHTNNNFLFINNSNIFSGKSISIWYKSLKKLNLDEIYRIEACNNIKIENSTKKTIINSDKYIYSAKTGVHVLLAVKQDITYKDPLNILTVKDRIEYFSKENIVVLRGKPKITGKYNFNSNTYYNFSSNIFNIQLTDVDSNKQKNSLTNKNIVFIEAINNVYFNEGETTITADYAIYYKEHNQIEFYDNVTFTFNNSSVKGNSAIYNLNSGYGKLISNNKNEPIKGKYQPTKK